MPRYSDSRHGLGLELGHGDAAKDDERAVREAQRDGTIESGCLAVVVRRSSSSSTSTSSSSSNRRIVHRVSSCQCWTEMSAL